MTFFFDSVELNSNKYDTSDPPGHFRLNSKVIKGGSDASGSKRVFKT